MVLEWFKKKEKVDLEARLGAEGYCYKYLGILDTYDVDWSLEKAARDTWQNFFDGNNGTLDDVTAMIMQEGRDYVVRLWGEEQYDFRRLLHLGGTTKRGNQSMAGGMGEGTKIVALVLLRDYGFSQVKFGSGKWEVEFVLDNIPEEDYPEKIKGLFACLRKAEREIGGNFVELKTPKKKFAQVFSDTKDLFYHSSNSDFWNPTLDVPEVGGFKFLGKNLEGGDIPGGNFYHVGQRRYFNLEEWNTVEYVNLWMHRKFDLRKDRDRGIITRKDIGQAAFRIVAAANVKDLINAVYEMEPIWEASNPARPSSHYHNAAGTSILSVIVSRLKSKKIKLKFEEKYLASSSVSTLGRDSTLIKQGYVLCFSFMEDIGMKSSEDKYLEMQKHSCILPTMGEKARIELLYQAAVLLKKETKDIYLFDRKAEKSIFVGRYERGFVWIAKERFYGSFCKALGTYLHELDHEYGPDISAEFSYALTDTLEKVIDDLIKQPELYQKLEKQWNYSLVSDTIKSRKKHFF